MDHPWNELCCRLRLTRAQRNPTGQESHDVQFSLATTAPAVSLQLLILEYHLGSSSLSHQKDRDHFQTFWKTVSQSLHQTFIHSSQYDFFLFGPQISSVFSAYYTLMNHCVISKGVMLNIKLEYAKHIVSFWVIIVHHKYCLIYCSLFSLGFSSDLHKP